MALVKACNTSDVMPGRLKLVPAGGRDLVIANVGGEYHAMENECTHEQGNLSEGDLNGNALTCPDHGAQFDVTTGRVVMGPDGEKPDSLEPVKVYRVTVQGNELMVEIP
jgi:3-phenylpropionate/trans-cinnamate dioxygenase ferredoxin subunit